MKSFLTEFNYEIRTNTYMYAFTKEIKVAGEKPLRPCETVNFNIF